MNMTSSRINLALTLTVSFFAPVLAVVACGGDQSAPAGSGGTNGTGGNAGTSTTGGSAGTATTGGAPAGGSGGDGAGGTSAGTAGSGGGTPMTPQACNASILAADAPIISNFSVIVVNGETTNWGQALGDASSGVDQ